MADQVAQVPDVGGRADEGEGDEVDAEREGEVEVGEVLARQRRDRNRDAREVHALVRADQPADEDVAAGAAVLDLLDAQPHEAVVDQDVVTRLEDLPDHLGQHLELTVGRAVAGDDDLLAARERHGLGQVADAELRALEVGDQGERLAELGAARRGRCAREPRGPRASRARS